MGRHDDWPCRNCGSTDYHKIYSGRDWEYCNICGDIGSVSVPDVFWDGKEEHGLPDNPETGKPMVFASKRDKAIYLKSQGLIEAGDKIRGGHATIMRDQVPHETSMDDARRALADVKRMGKDVRRQQYLKILKESGRI